MNQRKVSWFAFIPVAWLMWGVLQWYIATGRGVDWFVLIPVVWVTIKSYISLISRKAEIRLFLSVIVVSFMLYFGLISVFGFIDQFLAQETTPLTISWLRYPVVKAVFLLLADVLITRAINTFELLKHAQEESIAYAILYAFGLGIVLICLLLVYLFLLIFQYVLFRVGIWKPSWTV